MYLRYVYKLHDLHIASDNFIEAGCTLLVRIYLPTYDIRYSINDDLISMAFEHINNGK